MRALPKLRIANSYRLLPHLPWICEAVTLPPTLFQVFNGGRPKSTHAALLSVAHEGNSDSLDQTVHMGTISSFELVLLISVDGAGMGSCGEDVISGRFQDSFDQRVLGEKDVWELGPRVECDSGQILGTVFHDFLGGELDRRRSHMVQLG